MITVKRDKRPLDEQARWVTSAPFLMFHFIPFLGIWTGVTVMDWVVCGFLYFSRMFFITAAYHRYFSHRTYRMGRVMQFLMALGGATAAQKGVLWWAYHHRLHHRASDQPGDVHSPRKGFWWSHIGWVLCTKYEETDYEVIKDFAKYGELRWLNKYHLVPPVVLGFLVYVIGGSSMVVIGFFLSTVLVYHGTFSINSFTHIVGRRRYATSDTSRNSMFLALVTMGEGWHNNHHHYQASVRQGFFWWEVDITYYILKLMSWFGLVHDLKYPPANVLTRNLIPPTPKPPADRL
ncbi:MAG: acyl-CoA desaturase [bacterium]|nr:acyl-CoA desaturase [bacterium]